MSNKYILVIPGGFVPYNDTVTLLSYKHLRNIDANFDVVALEGKKDEGINDTVCKEDNFKKFNVEYVCKYDDAVATFERKNVISGVYNLIKYCLKARKKAKEKKYDVVYTSSIPAFTHLAGYLVKKIYKDDIKWIASISDPLYKSPYKYDEESIKEYSLIAKVGFYVYIFIYMNGFYEKLVQKYADKVIYICEEERDFCINNYPNKDELLAKSMIIPLNYVDSWNLYHNLIVNENKKHDGKMVCSHFGRVYGLRKLDNFLLALKKMKSDDPLLSKKIVFRQYGQFIDRYVNRIHEYDLDDLFEFNDKVPYDKAMELMKESDALLLFDTIMPEDQIQPYLPSKSLEYILLKKPCLIITTKLSPAYRIFSDLGYKCAFDDVDSIIEAINDVINNNHEYNYDYTIYKNEVATKELKEYIERI